MASSVAWGIDVGNRALKAVKLVREGEGVRIDDFDVVEHEHILSNAGDNRETLIQTALATFAGRHNIKGIPVSVGVSGQQSFARFIKLPPVEPSKIPEIVRFEAIQQIPFPLEEVEWSYQLFQDEASPDVEVGIFAMRKDLVQQHMDFFTAAGMNVEVVQMNPLGVYNALAYDERLKGTTMVIDLGSENADLIITEGESIWMRSIPIGGNHFTEAIAKQFQLRFEKAEELKRNAATSKYGRQILQAMRPIFADLVSEIQRSIGFYSSVHRDSRIQRVLALGGTFNLPGLQKYLQQNLSLDVVKVDSIGQAPPAEAKVATTLSENILSAVGAYGLALQVIGGAKIGSSLLPKHIMRERMWRSKTKWFAAAAACFVAGTAMAITRYQLDDYKYTQNEGVRKEIQSTYTQAKGLSDSWGKVEKDGEADRKKLTEVKSVTQFRELWPSIYADLQASVPDLPRPAANQPDRRIIVEDFHSDYHADMGPILAASEPQFNTYASPRDWTAGDPRVKRSGAAGNGGGGGSMLPVFPAGGVMPMLPPGGMGPDRMGGRPGPMAGPVPGASTDAAAATAGPRGYLVTLHIVTPVPDRIASGVVETTLRATLMQREAAAAAEAKASGKPRPFKIEKIAVPSCVQFDRDQGRVAYLTQRATQAAARKAAAAAGALLTPGAGGAMMPAPMTPMPMNGMPMEGGRLNPPAAGMFAQAGGYGIPNMTQPGGMGAAPGQSAPPIDVFVDPATGENQKNWSDVTVLIAITADPPIAPPAPAGDGTAQ